MKNKNMKNKIIEIFVTGTDTDVGKTVVSAGILAHANKLGLSTIGFKPISAGCDVSEAGLRNNDALALMDTASIDCDYDLVNPIAYQAPIAPHIAAKHNNEIIDLTKINQSYQSLLAKQPDLLLTEGAGGWQLPITNTSYFSTWVADKKLDVVLVVGIKLGCLNHAVLTAQAIEASRANLVGWVANSLSADIANYDEMVITLKEALGKPLLGEVPYFSSQENQTPELYLDLTSILKK